MVPMGLSDVCPCAVTAGGANSDPRVGVLGPLCAGGCGCVHPAMLIFSPLLLKQNKKMKRKHQKKVKRDWRRGSFLAVSVSIPVSQDTGPTGVFGVELIGC